MTDAPVLEVRDLSLVFRGGRGTHHALSDVSFTVGRGEVLSLVGESGCGKSVTAMAILGLLPRRGAEVSASAIRLAGTDIFGLPERAMRKLRGNRIGMIFQDPMTSLNPVHTVGLQIGETIRRHRGVSHAAARTRARELLDLVEIPGAARRLDAYPHELSGGMRQRVMIAMALSCDPELLIADEPTTALDVTIQAQILALIGSLTRELGMSVILITHDLGVVAEAADRVAVMYAGRIVEEGPVPAVFARPSHGYTAGLLRALPGHRGSVRGMLDGIEGAVPRLDTVVEGCVFAPRCRFAAEECDRSRAERLTRAPGHLTACARPDAVYQSVADLDIVAAWQ